MGTSPAGSLVARSPVCFGRSPADRSLEARIATATRPESSVPCGSLQTDDRRFNMSRPG